MTPEKTINKEATVKNIMKVAKGHIKDYDIFNKLISNDEDLKLLALFWSVEIVYN